MNTKTICVGLLFLSTGFVFSQMASAQGLGANVDTI